MPGTRIDPVSKPSSPTSRSKLPKTTINNDLPLIPITQPAEIAISPNNNEVQIFKREPNNEWRLLDILQQHDLRIMGIDWAPETNRIVTCGVDRNAYVWTQSTADDGDQKWKPMLVHLRINRAATCVKWSPLENKFAVGSGARIISVCYFEQENDWWVSKHIKKPIRSTVTSLDWHPNNVLLVAGSTDYKARVFSGYIKVIEEQPLPTSWGARMSFGQLMAEYGTGALGGGWVNSVSFSADGTRICWVGHNSTVNVADATRMQSVSTEFLPFLCCEWVGADSVIVAGHNCVPLVYRLVAEDGDAGGLRPMLAAKLDHSQKREQGGISAMRIFKSLDRNAKSENADTNLESIHQNAIACVCLYAGDKAGAQRISTSGLDGQLVIWDMAAAVAANGGGGGGTLSRSMHGLAL